MIEINGGHPFWGIVRLAVIFTGLTVFLYLNSSSFDKTEVTTIIELLILIGGFEAGRKMIQANGKKKEKEKK